MTQHIVYVTKRVRLSIAHQLNNNNSSESKNESTFGKCNTIHGHNMWLETTVKGVVNPNTGMVTDLKQLKKLLEEVIISVFDHKYLGDIEHFKDSIQTSENIIIHFWNLIEKSLTEGTLYRLRLFETEDNYVEYYGE